MLYDLGCGDAKVLVEAVRNGCEKCVGVDMDPDVVAKALDNVAQNEMLDKITVIEGNFLEIDISEATIIYVFLLPKALEALREKFLQAFQNGKLKRIVSTLYDMPFEEYNQIENTEYGFFIYTLKWLIICLNLL